MAVIFIGALIFAVISVQLTRNFGLEKWQVSTALIGLGALFYLLNVLLIKHYIRKRTPDFASTEEVLPGVQKWELTAGVGIVPKWVSVIGLLAISAFITAGLPWIIALTK